MKFTKMQGNGNDFVVIEDLKMELRDLDVLSQKLCDRHYGVGGDGILVVRNADVPNVDIEMIIINSDGSYASMCGNGIRCFAKYIWEKGIVKKEIINILTGDGIKTAFLTILGNKVDSIAINMGTESFEPAKIPAVCNEEILSKSFIINSKEYMLTSMLMGVPHTIIIGRHEDFDVTEGKHIEKFNIFPQGTNVNFCEVISPTEVKVKTWERGAGPTLACGTGSCASVAAGYKLGLLKKNVKVNLPGGALHIELTDEGIIMKGPAEIVFSGEIEI